MKVKVTMSSGLVQYYGGKDKDGGFLLTDIKRAKEYNNRAKGSLNPILSKIEKDYCAKCEYVD